jgi:hypothetical protein
VIKQWVRLCLLGLVSLAWAGGATAVTTVFHCVKDGQTVLTDKPCDPASSTSSPADTASGSESKTAPTITALPTLVGEWRGQTQYQGTENGQMISEANSVVPLYLSFSADGKISGSSLDNACTVLGIRSPGVASWIFNLDVSMKGCHFSRFNRRFSGNLTANFAQHSAQLSLHSYDLSLLGEPARAYDVKATLRR